MAGSGIPTKSGPISSSLRICLIAEDDTSHPIRYTPLSIGRRDADLVVAHPTVSSRHARIEQSGQGFVVVDEGSTNGTMVNSAPVHAHAPQVIENLDEIRFGDKVFTFSVVEDRYGMHEGEATAPGGNATQTLLIASAPSVAALRADEEVLLHTECGGVDLDIRLEKRLSTVGRKDGDIVLDDQTLSRRHFQIEVHPDHLALKDLGSANGTHLAGKPISYVRLEPGQEFTAGRTRFSVERRKK